MSARAKLAPLAWQDVAALDGMQSATLGTCSGLVWYVGGERPWHSQMMSAGVRVGPVRHYASEAGAKETTEVRLRKARA